MEEAAIVNSSQATTIRRVNNNNNNDINHTKSTFDVADLVQDPGVQLLWMLESRQFQVSSKRRT